MRKEKLEEKYNFVKNKNNFQTILNNINNFGKSSLALGQILLFLLVAGSAFNYGVVYIFTLKYPIELTFEQFLTFGFSNLFTIALIILLTYMLIEAIISFSVMKITNFIDVIMKYSIIATIVMMQLFIFLIMGNFDIITLFVSMGAFLMFFILVLILLSRKTEINIIRFAWACITICHFCFLNYNASAATGLGDYNATIMVDKNSFIKDIIDIEKPFKDGDKEKYTKNYHYKGDHIELKDVKVLSTLGDIAYVELCSENMEIEKTLGDCRKSIRVEFIKKDIHIIRDGKKQDIANTEDSSDKTNNESKEQNEQDLEKSKQNKQEENTTKNN